MNFDKFKNVFERKQFVGHYQANAQIQLQQKTHYNFPKLKSNFNPSKELRSLGYS